MRNDRNYHLNSSSEEIAALISRFRASGMGLERFARKNGIPPGRLHYWFYQKHRGALAPGSSPPSKVVGAPVFQEVKLTASAPLAGHWAAEVSLPRGVVVRFSAAAMPAWIGSVIQALQQPC